MPKIEIPKPPTLEELKAACTTMQYWSDENYDCVDLEFYFGSLTDLISIKLKKEDGSIINLHSNVDGRRLRELRKKRKKKIKDVAAPAIDNSPPMTIMKLDDKQIVLKMNYGLEKGKISRGDQVIISLAFYMFEPSFEDKDTEKQMIK